MNLAKNKRFYLQNQLQEIGFFFADKIYENFTEKSKNNILKENWKTKIKKKNTSFFQQKKKIIKILIKTNR